MGIEAQLTFFPLLLLIIVSSILFGDVTSVISAGEGFHILTFMNVNTKHLCSLCTIQGEKSHLPLRAF